MSVHACLLRSLCVRQRRLSARTIPEVGEGQKIFTATAGVVSRHSQLANSWNGPMKIHEYQAKAILAQHGVPVPRGEVAFNAAEAGAVARRLGSGSVVVKAQIHAGGRGKGGGVKLAKSVEDAEKLASQMIGMTLVTHQTGVEGR